MGSVGKRCAVVLRIPAEVVIARHAAVTGWEKTLIVTWRKFSLGSTDSNPVGVQSVGFAVVGRNAGPIQQHLSAAEGA